MSAPQEGNGSEIFYLRFQDADPFSPFEKGDRFELSDKILDVYRGEELIQRFNVINSFAQWGNARSESNLYIEYTRSGSDSPQTPVSIYGHLVQEVVGGNTPPPVGVWGADTQPPGGGSGRGR